MQACLWGGLEERREGLNVVQNLVRRMGLPISDNDLYVGQFSNWRLPDSLVLTEVHWILTAEQAHTHSKTVNIYSLEHRMEVGDVNVDALYVMRWVLMG